MSKKSTYRQEFFDREYSAKEAYGRLWSFARKYWFRLMMGILCGMLTAGTLVPMFSLIQPTLAKVEQRQERGSGEPGVLALPQLPPQDGRASTPGSSSSTTTASHGRA